MDAGGILVRYDAACRALAEAKAVDEVKDIRDKAEAMRAYARQAKNRDLEIDAAEIRIRAERRVGELMSAQRETFGLAQGKRTDLGPERTQVAQPTLEQAGIDKHLADRARKLAAVPAPQFEEKMGEWRERVAAESERVTTQLLEEGAKHVRGTFGTGENEWYTPEEYIEAARHVLGGLDLDPATSELAQARIKAAAFHCAEDDGLKHEWRGRIWLNPPYAQPLIADFVFKMVDEVIAGHVAGAIMVTHNYTDTSWFQEAARVADAICFTRGRVKFVDARGNVAAPTQGQGPHSSEVARSNSIGIARQALDAGGLIPLSAHQVARVDAVAARVSGNPRAAHFLALRAVATVMDVRP